MVESKQTKEQFSATVNYTKGVAHTLVITPDFPPTCLEPFADQKIYLQIVSPIPLSTIHDGPVFGRVPDQYTQEDMLAQASFMLKLHLSGTLAMWKAGASQISPRG